MAEAGIWLYQFSTATTEPPAGSQIRFNTSVMANITKMWVPISTSDGIDIYYALINVDPTSTLILQDKNNHAQIVELTCGLLVDKTTYIEFPVTWVANSAQALTG